MSGDHKYKFTPYSSPRRHNSGGMLRKTLQSPLLLILAINVAVFLILGGIRLFAHEELVPFLALKSSWKGWISAPWGLLTYMFVQSDFLNLLFNMLWLWGFGFLMTRMDGGKVFLGTYLLSGVAGGLSFLCATSLTQSGGGYLIGASASVIGVIVGSATRHPRMELNLMLFGNVQLRWIALIAFLLCGIAPGLDNTPTLLTHVGGAMGGFLYVFLKYNNFKNTAKSRKRVKHNPKIKPMNVRLQERKGLSPIEQNELDSLLEQVRKSGFNSLSIKERTRLFALSNKIKT